MRSTRLRCNGCSYSGSVPMVLQQQYWVKVEILILSVAVLLLATGAGNLKACAKFSKFISGDANRNAYGRISHYFLRLGTSMSAGIKPSLPFSPRSLPPLEYCPGSPYSSTEMVHQLSYPRSSAFLNWVRINANLLCYSLHPNLQ